MSAAAALPRGPLILDSGGILAYISGQSYARHLCQHIYRAGLPLILPAAVYAQVERGASGHLPVQQHLNALRNLCIHAPLSMEIAYQAGVILGLAGRADVVDAAVVVEALRHEGAIILTSDSGDIRYLLGFTANQYRRGIRIVPV